MTEESEQIKRVLLNLLNKAKKDLTASDTTHQDAMIANTGSSVLSPLNSKKKD
jgi:hypothetical protein